MKKVFLIIVFFLNIALCAAWDNEQKLTASDGVAYDHFGCSVSISGDYAVIGAHYDDDNGSASGSAYIFHRIGTTWSEQAKLTASDGEDKNQFGLSVSISGDYAVIGAYLDDDNGSESGSAYIFHRIGTTWSEQVKITASDGAVDDHFGCSVSISGDYAVIGADGDDSNKGSAYIFHRTGTTWSEQVKITASDGGGYDYFGWSVSIDGDYAVIGAYFDDDNGSNSGSAYIYQRTGATWSEQIKITASDGSDGDMFGVSVSISGDYAVIGATGDNGNASNSGSAFIFYRIGSTWSEQAKITASDGDSHDEFGGKVSISEDYAVIGAWGDDDNGSASGSAYIFYRDGTTWSEQVKITASDAAEDDRFGYSVSISEDYAVIGAYLDDDNGSRSGSAYIYYNDSVFVEEEHVNIPDNTILLGNYPNPFNPSTTISFSTAENAKNAKIIIYNLKGQRIKTFRIPKSKIRTLNQIVWDGKDESGNPLSSGIYFYQLKVGNKVTDSKKCLLLR